MWVLSPQGLGTQTESKGKRRELVEHPHFLLLLPDLLRCEQAAATCSHCHVLPLPHVPSATCFPLPHTPIATCSCCHVLLLPRASHCHVLPLPRAPTATCSRFHVLSLPCAPAAMCFPLPHAPIATAISCFTHCASPP